jgi:hypothetical protein
MEEVRHIPAIAVATEFLGEHDADGFAPAQAWAFAQPLRFASDWRGENADLARETEVRLLWTNENLYLRFCCNYRTLTVFADSDANGRRDQLWDRDVAEVFLQTDASQTRRYWEFEISPNGMWVDLEISPEGKRDPGSGMKSRVAVNEAQRIWRAELVLPMAVLVNDFDACAEWRANFFRVEGATEPRFYSAWRPTRTPQPNFHVPETFGILRFRKA